MPQSSFALEIKAVDGSNGTFEGLAAVYGNVDEHGDVIVPGAFTKTLMAARERPLLLEHRNAIGTVSLTDSTAGLVARGKLTLGATAGKDAHELLKSGALKGLSVGFQTLDYDYAGEARRLKELKLYEVSLVAIPANPQANVTSFKTFKATENEIKSALKYFRKEVLSVFNI